MIPGDTNIKRDIPDPGTTRMIPAPSPKNIIKTINTIKTTKSILVPRITDKDPEMITTIAEMTDIEMIGKVEVIEMTDKKEPIVETGTIETIKNILKNKLRNISKEF
jgi:hypothetical protein